MINIDDKHILMIEPTSAPTAPLIDDITRKMAAAWRHRTTGSERYRGWHDCTGQGCMAASDNADHEVFGLATNSLCVHYVARHRAEIPQAMLDVIAGWDSVVGVDPTAEELGPGPAPDPLQGLSADGMAQAAEIAALLDAALASYQAGIRLHLSIHGDDTVAALVAWTSGRDGIALETSHSVSSHPRGEQRWTMARACVGGDNIVTAHSTPVVTERPGDAR